MPRLKPLLKYPRISAALLRPGNVMSSAPVQGYGKVGVVRVLPGWECKGWARIFNTTPPHDVAVFEEVCLRDITTFITERTTAHREALKIARRGTKAVTENIAKGGTIALALEHLFPPRKKK